MGWGILRKGKDDSMGWVGWRHILMCLKFSKKKKTKI